QLAAGRGGEEVGLRFERRRLEALRHRADRPDRVGERHQRAAVHGRSGGLQLVAHLQLSHHLVRRGLDNADAEVGHQALVPLLHARLLYCHPILRNRVAVRESSDSALSASDQWMPSSAPPRPTVIPLNARKPRLVMAKSPITRPRNASGARICTRVCAIALNESSRNPATNSTPSASA